MADKNTIKSWFETGLKPTQAQFGAWIDSYRHKDEKIPITAIDDIENILNAKADAEAFTNHVDDADAHADLFDVKEDKTQKGIARGYVPLDEFVKIASEYLTIVNDLVTGGSTSLASAETVKTLKTQIDGVNTLLSSDNVNLDNVQELVDAIETVQTSLSTILVNGFSGGTTKALTAEMGKFLYDAVGVLSQNIANIQLEVKTKIKSINSSALGSQNAAGIVTYINALNPPLSVAANEIVKYSLTDTGRVFELLLRGRNFGVGQAAIVAADVLEITDFLNKDIRLSNYPNTRNDGQLSTNKILTTDVYGNVKLCTMAIIPAPYLEVLVPDSTLPSTTTNFVLKGAFFTPTMTVAIAGQTINYITFINDNEVRVNVTTSALEGYYSVTLNNGLQSVFNNALLIVLGTAFSPVESEWTNLVAPINVREYGNARIGIWDSAQSAKWTKVLDYTKNFSIRFNLAVSPYGANIQSYQNCLNLVKVSNGATVFTFRHVEDYGNVQDYLYTAADGYLYIQSVPVTNYWETIGSKNFELRWYNGVMYAYLNNVLKATSTQPLTENLKLQVNLQRFDIVNIKYIELAS